MIYTPPKNSLHILPEDNRDFALGAVFEQLKLSDVPNTDFVVAEPLGIKDQGESDLCSAYAVTAVSEDQEGIELLPEYQFFRTKQLSGNPEEWGANLRDACKSAVKFGSLPIKNGVARFDKLKGISRSEALIPENWTKLAQEIAEYHKKQTYFSVSGQYDVFDNIRVALWQHRAKKCSIVTGILWRSEWITAPDGIIQKEYGNGGFGHAFKIFGQKNIKGELHLVAQLSQGIQAGDNGIFYFPREVVNREIGKYGIYMFNDITREEAEALMKKKEKIPSRDGFFSNLWSFFIRIFQ